MPFSQRSHSQSRVDNEMRLLIGWMNPLNTFSIFVLVFIFFEIFLMMLAQFISQIFLYSEIILLDNNVSHLNELLIYNHM